MSISHLTLFRRSNGIWYVLFREEGRQRWKSTGKRLKHEALEILTTFQVSLPSRPQDVLFTAFISQFQSLQGTALRPSTLERICLPTFRTFLRISGNRLLKSYTLRDIEFFKAERLKTCSPATVSLEFRTLRSAFNLAVKWQLLRENPCLLASSVNKVEQVPTYLGKEDFQRLIGAVREPVLRDIFSFAALTGMRQGEILNLRWDEVDLEKKVITVAGGGRYLTKSGKIRVIPMSHAVVDILRRRKLTQAQFVFHKKGFPLLRDNVCHKFKSYIREVGLNDKLHFHSLRHTFASWLVQDGVSLYEVQKLLGHSNISVTQVYSHLQPEKLHSTVNRINISVN